MGKTEKSIWIYDTTSGMRLRTVEYDQTLARGLSQEKYRAFVCKNKSELLKKDVKDWEQDDFEELNDEQVALLQKLQAYNNPLCSTRLFSKMDEKEDNNGDFSDDNGDLKERFLDKVYLNIVSSKEFRKLQDKTQIFPLAKSDYVRTRLTHSIEVSIIARQIAYMIYARLKDEQKEQANETELKRAFLNCHNDVESIVACAGLLHDLGNPPFGHFGEDAIGEWFKKDENKKVYEEKISKQQLTDLQKFEGNAQSLRILSKNYYRKNERLSVPISVASALVKYPNVSTSKEISKEDNSPVYRHKMGINQSEEAVFKKLSKIVLNKEDKGITRNPLAYIVEAADDIAYVTSDIQDSIAAGIISFDEVKELEPFADDPEMWGDLLRTKYKSAVCDVFIKSFEEISQGTFGDSLVDASLMKGIDDKLRELMRDKVYEHPILVEPELTAVTIVNFLLDTYVPLCEKYAIGDKFSGIEKKYFSLVPEDLVNDYKNWLKDTPKAIDKDKVYHGILIATDYISGMTDGEAKATYQLIKGID